MRHAHHALWPLLALLLVGCFTFGVEAYDLVLQSTEASEGADLLRLENLNVRGRLSIVGTEATQEAKAVIALRVVEAWRSPQEGQAELRWRRQGDSLEPILTLGELSPEVVTVERVTIDSPMSHLVYEGGCDDMVVRGLSGLVDLNLRECDAILDTTGPVDARITEGGELQTTLRAGATLRADSSNLDVRLLPEMQDDLTVHITKGRLNLYIDPEQGYNFKIKTYDAGLSLDIILMQPDFAESRYVEEEFVYQGGGPWIDLMATDGGSINVLDLNGAP